MTQRLTPDPEIDALIHKLNREAQGDQPEAVHDDPATEEIGAPSPHTDRPRWRLAPADDESKERLSDLLGEARRRGATDLLLVARLAPHVRIDGRLAKLSETPLDAAELERLISGLLPRTRRETATSRGAVDFALSSRPSGRLRVNVHRQRGSWAVAIRFLADEIGELKALNLPESLADLADLDHGLVLVTGPTGTGKSTTLAALVRMILRRRAVHLITIEDPVEYEQSSDKGVVEHIEIGRDTLSFKDALRSAMRQDPDVILVGEMRDSESISMAITAAETGHLVLSTLHTADAPQTIHRVLDSYPPNQIDSVRTQLAYSLAAVVSQQLLPRKDGKGRVPAVEILLATSAVRSLIRQNKIAHLRNQFTFEKTKGLLSLDRSLALLVQRGLVDHDEARVRARVQDEFDRLVKALPG